MVIIFGPIRDPDTKRVHALMIVQAITYVQLHF